MARESSKTKQILTQEEWGYFVGAGIDIGCGDDPITPICDRFDIQDGDANHILDYVHRTYDWVYSSHCLEHLDDPYLVVKDWGQLVEIGGYFIIIVPDEDLYEQGYWPSRFNDDHKHTFTIAKRKSWSPVSINVLDLVRSLENFDLIQIELQDIGYNHQRHEVDQTLGDALAQIMVVLKRRC